MRRSNQGVLTRALHGEGGETTSCPCGFSKNIFELGAGSDARDHPRAAARFLSENTNSWCMVPTAANVAASRDTRPLP